jgi:hypothetical protein
VAVSDVVRGLPELLAKLQKLGPNAMKQAGAGLYQEAQVIEGVAAERCPKDDGILWQTIKTQKPEYTSDDVSVTIVAGTGPSAAYAIAVHEHLSEHSPPSWKKAGKIHWRIPGTGPKFLENPVMEAKGNLLDRVARRIDIKRAI